VYSKVFIGIMAVATFATMSCGGKKHDAEYYMNMVDSIRKAEQVKEIQQKAGIYQDPVDAWFDTLGVRTLPIRTVGAELWRIGHFSSVPTAINENFCYPVDAKLKAMALPSFFSHPVVLLAEMADSVNPKLFLYTMTKKHQTLDWLSIYAHKETVRNGVRGKIFSEYFVTSKYEISILLFFQPFESGQQPQLLSSRKYCLNKEGKFKEIIKEL